MAKSKAFCQELHPDRHPLGQHRPVPAIRRPRRAGIRKDRRYRRPRPPESARRVLQDQRNFPQGLPRVVDVPAHANATAQARGLDGHEELSHDGTSRRRQVLRPHPRVRKTLIARSRASLRLFRGIFPGYRRGQRHMLGRGGRATSLCNSGFVMVDYFGFICVSAICSLMQSAIDRIPCGTCDNPVV